MQLSSKLLLVVLVVCAPPALAAAQAAPEPMAPPRRDLSLRLDLGGTEPTTAKQAFEGNVSWRGIPAYELQAGWSWSDQVYYSSNRGYATAYRYYADGMSYVKADASLRKYDYPSVGGQPPSPDSNSYLWVPRGELEWSHLFTEAWRGTVQYQLFPASFWHDTSSWTVNQKLSGQVDWRPIRRLTLSGRFALLRDPDPKQTEIKGRVPPAVQSDPACAVPAPPARCSVTAAKTSVAYRTTSLVGGSVAVDLDRVGLKVEVLPNRDLDSSYAWSFLGTVDVRVTQRVDLRLQGVHDSYASVSAYHGRAADIVMGAVGYAVNDALRLRGGYRYVDVPDFAGAPQTYRRRTGALLVGLEYRPAL